VNILLAGGNGFIGSQLKALLKSKATITTLDANSSSNASKSRVLNLTDSDAVDIFAETCDQIDVLIFLVGLAHAKGKGKDYPIFKEVNFGTMANLIGALDRNNKVPRKIIFASTISVYGERYSQREYREHLVPMPFSPYAVTKLEAEQYLLNGYSDKSWILRFAPVYSAEFTLNLDRRSKIRRFFYKVGNGKRRFSLCNLNNIVTSMDAIINGDVPPDVYNISDPINYTYNDLLNYQNSKIAFRIPKVIVHFIYVFGLITKNIFLMENSTKLITDNVYLSDKIRSYVNLSATLDEN
jgi:nucleoside-diphosphate-sugar epimerase